MKFLKQKFGLLVIIDALLRLSVPLWGISGCGKIDVVVALVFADIGGPDGADGLAQGRAEGLPVDQIAGECQTSRPGVFKKEEWTG